MQVSRNLSLPYLSAAQSQKHITHNEAIQQLDALVHLAVESSTQTSPPDEPADGARYLVASGSTGAWAGHGLEIAWYRDGGWAFLAPEPGWRLWDAEAGTSSVWDGSAWVASSGSDASTNPAPLVGVNATADATNKLSVKSDAALFSHDDATPGTGDIRLILNKAAAGNTASFLFQNAYAGMAEVGLAGNDDLSFKVADGGAWSEALRMRQSGRIEFPLTPLADTLVENPAMTMNQRHYNGLALAAGAYGFDRWKSGQAGTTIAVSSGEVTLNGTITQTLEDPGLAGELVTVSVDTLTGGSLTVSVGGSSATIAAGSGRRGVELTVPSAQTGNVDVTLAGSGVSFSQLSVTQGRTLARVLNPVEAEARCQRYFYRMNVGGWGFFVGAVADYTYRAIAGTAFPVTMRAQPTLQTAAMNTFRLYGANTIDDLTSITAYGVTPRGCTMQFNKTSAFTAGSAYAVLRYASRAAFIAFDAEV